MSKIAKQRRRQQLSSLERLLLWKPWFRSIKAPGESAWSECFVVTINLQNGRGNYYFHNKDLQAVVQEAIQFLQTLSQSGDPQR